jgi:hypothetical protein
MRIAPDAFARQRPGCCLHFTLDELFPFPSVDNSAETFRSHALYRKDSPDI